MALALEQVVKQVKDLPSLSAVVTELMCSMQDEDTDLNALAGKIALDQSLAAKTLRLANSSFYGMSSKVTTIHQAMAVLGFHSVRTLVTACAVTSSFPATSEGGLDFRAFWRHSVATAVAAKVLACPLKANPDLAFTVGLLHDIGILVLATRFPADYVQVQAMRIQRDCLLAEAEQAVLGLNHCTVGRELAEHWKFPLAIQQAVAGHHDAFQTSQAPLTLLAHAANTIAHGLDLSGDPDDQVPPISEAVWDMLPLSSSDGMRLLRETETTFNELCQILVN